MANAAAPTAFAILHPRSSILVQNDRSHPSILTAKYRIKFRADPYAALGVPEVWRFDGTELDVLILEDGKYSTATSRAFPELPVEGIVGFLEQIFDIDLMSLLQSFREWLRSEVLPNR